ncbi:M48 family metalloprotease [Roseiconus sp. JC912]|uniref:M48 family metalloprotease n=1 Tax=Roseiconus sp. JC912 TaxID=3396307 RepID=UPI003A4C5AEC
MQLYYFLAVVITLSFGALPAASQDVDKAVMFSAAVIGIWWAMCLMSVRMVINLIKAGEINEDTAYDWFDRQTACLRWFSLAIIALCLGGFGLGRSVDEIPLVSSSVTLQALYLLTPTVLVISGLWVAEHRFAQRLGLTTPGMAATFRWILLMVRATIAWIVVPILAMLVLVDIATLFPVSDAARGWGLAITMIALAVFGMPFVIKRAFPKTAIDQETSEWIGAILCETGMSNCKLVVWNTKGRSYNAMMAGFFGRFQVLFLTDRLVRDLNRAQLAMVILHEVAHARRKHALIRVIALAPAWAAGLSMQAMIQFLMPASALVAWGPIIGNALSLVATMLIIRQVSYFCEHDADAVACQLAVPVSKCVSDVPSSVDQAGRSLSSALVRVTEGAECARRPSWLHPGITQRIEAVLA